MFVRPHHYAKLVPIGAQFQIVHTRSPEIQHQQARIIETRGEGEQNVQAPVEPGHRAGGSMVNS